jgi:hypothetical protein
VDAKGMGSGESVYLRKSVTTEKVREKGKRRERKEKKWGEKICGISSGKSGKWRVVTGP